MVIDADSLTSSHSNLKDNRS